jgi:hypothetical protein
MRGLRCHDSRTSQSTIRREIVISANRSATKIVCRGSLLSLAGTRLVYRAHRTHAGYRNARLREPWLPQPPGA